MLRFRNFKGSAYVTALGVALALAGLALAGCGAKTTESAAAETSEAPLVELAEAAPLAGVGAVRASGLVGYRRETELSFTASGVVADILVDSGDVVRRGQRLAALRRTGLGANSDEAALARETAERDLERTQALYEQGFVSEARLDQARLAAARARDSSVLTAPTDGVILMRRAEPSQTISAGASVLSFGETHSGVVVRAPVASGEAARIHVGDAATLHINDLGGLARMGRVTRVGAKGHEGTGAFEVEIEIADSEGLRSGMVADAEIAAASAPYTAQSMLAPTMALLDARADQGVVFVVGEDNIARRRAVRTGGVTDAGVIIVEGLNAGERVVASGAAYVRDGEPVRIAASAG